MSQGFVLLGDFAEVVPTVTRFAGSPDGFDLEDVMRIRSKSSGEQPVKA